MYLCIENRKSVSDTQQFRAKYDPSHDGQRRQTEIQQAILCPQCNSPLGIPSIRPIKVKCPNCDSENVFTNWNYYIPQYLLPEVCLSLRLLTTARTTHNITAQNIGLEISCNIWFTDHV